MNLKGVKVQKWREEENFYLHVVVGVQCISMQDRAEAGRSMSSGVKGIGLRYALTNR